MKENYPLVGRRGGDDLPLGRKPVSDFFRQIPASRSSVMSISLTEESIHLPCAPDPDMVECFLEAEKMRTWALELKNGRAEEERRRG